MAPLPKLGIWIQGMLLALAVGACEGSEQAACQTPADCPDPLRYACQAGECVPLVVACSTPADCPDPLGYTCSNGTCVPLNQGCLQDGDCQEPAAPFCLHETCFACALDEHCIDPVLPRCVQGVCEGTGACTADAQCTEPDAPVCVEGACIECREDADCLEPGLSRCVQGVCQAGGCVNDASCLDPLLPYCQDSDCVACRTSAHCLEPTAPLCRAGACVPTGCANDAQCVEPGLPYCLDGECAECRTSVHCAEPTPRCDGGQCVVEQVPCGQGARPTQFTWPVPSIHHVCQAFGVPVTYQTCQFHTGTDICGTVGVDIVSIADGRVVHVGPMWLQGDSVGRGDHAIIVQHSPSFYSTYGHNDSARVSEGDCVTRGQHIAEMGDEGYSGGPHLHIEVLTDTSFTGDWETPFNNACSHYEDLEDFVGP